MNTIHTLDIAGLEQVYDRLATAIDEAGPEKSELFLVKLALLNAKALGQPDLFAAQRRSGTERSVYLELATALTWGESLKPAHFWGY